jgi:CRISPR/Cas system-associated protein Csm6
MAINIITTVGISLFLNYYKQDETRDRKRFNQLNDKSKRASDWKKYAEDLSHIPDLSDVVWKAIEENTSQNLSAEIQSVLAIEAETDTPVVVRLLATDTLTSRMAAELIEKWFKKHHKDIHVCFDPERDIIIGLQVEDYTLFRDKGIQGLVKRINELRESLDESDDAYLNVSGGFKGIVPVLTIFAQLYKLPLYYQYEESDRLMEVAPMPLGFDWRVIKRYMSYLLDLTRITGDRQAAPLKRLHLIQGEYPNYQRTVIGTLLADFVEKEDIPFFDDVLGYLVEHKLFECFLSDYPDAIHGYVPSDLAGIKDHDWEDIDLLLPETNLNSFIAAEIKPFQKLNKRGSFAKIVKKLCDRVQLAEKDRDQNASQLWVILYSKGTVPPDVESRHQNYVAAAAQIVSDKMGRDIPLVVKHFCVAPNLVDGQDNRMRYHQFLRESLAPDAIVDLISNVSNQQP